MSEKRRTAQQIREHVEQLRRSEMFAFADELEAVLEAAVTEHDVLKTLVHVARGISKSALMGLDIAYGEIMQLDDAIMGAGAVVDETRWLEEDKQCK